MHMGRERLTNGILYGRFIGDNDCGRVDRAEGYREDSPHMVCSAKLLPIESPSSSPPSSTSSSPLPSSFSSGSGFIEHRVSKLDTLAGIAIKYGVEVADIKRMNGLTTDLQMYALRSIQIPLPGRHPPSQCLSSGTLSFTSGEQSTDHTSSCHEQTPPSGSYYLLDSFQSLKLRSSRHKISPAMSLLQDYYGLKLTQRTVSGHSQMAICKEMGAADCPDESPFLKPYLPSHPPLSSHKKARGLVNSLFDEFEEFRDDTSGRDSGEDSLDKKNETLSKRRQKSEADFTSRTPEKLLKEDGTKNGVGFSPITGKGLALRSKASYPNPITNGGISGTDGSAVRKSSSTSSLQDQEGNGIASKWNRKTDLQGFTAATITNSILDGLPKPLTGRKYKTAVD